MSSVLCREGLLYTVPILEGDGPLSEVLLYYYYHTLFIDESPWGIAEGEVGDLTWSRGPAGIDSEKL